MSIKNQDFAAIIAHAAQKETDAKALAQELWYALYREKKLGQLEQIFSAAQELVDRQQKQIRAKVISGVALSADEQEMIRNKLANNYSEKIIIENIIDKSLGAGIEIKVGSKTFDYSLKGKIQQLDKKMKEKYEI